MYNSYNWLYDNYVIKKRNLYEISQDAGVSQQTILNWMKKHNIKSRGKSLSQLANLNADISKENLFDLYVTKEMSANNIENKLGISHVTVLKYLRLYNIPIRTCNFNGSNNPNWKGGISQQKYCYKFNEPFKQYIREKFNNTCFICGKSKRDNGKNLFVHHIDYNKNAICNGKEWAFVPLCASCHSKTNGNRWYYYNLLINYWAYKYMNQIEI
jgi:hypothetical protein